MMTYKETLFFIGKCLTISHEKKNYEEVELELQSGKIDWDQVVKVSTGQFVFPALYCNLKRMKFLHYLPKDLVEYMEHITNLNRDRNQQIIEQAKEINKLLLSNNITPIFLKGTGNLLEGLYEDIAERMVGDIDFLVSDSEFKSTIYILKKFYYSEFHKNKPDTTLTNRHYPKMTKEGRIASIEVHYKMVSNLKIIDFNYDFIFPNILKNKHGSFLSHKDNIIMTSINKQFNDNGQFLKNINLRNSYDLFLLSKKENTIESIKKLKNHKELNCFIYSCYNIFNKPKSINFDNNDSAKLFYKKQIHLLDNPKSSLKKRITKDQLKYSHRFKTLLKALYNKDYFNYVLNRIKSKL
ncbi:nucleotidyltransferase family protein [Tenacibaculum sp. S7007]|uniref:Nucleotidyltransferase family protein n=1 Tax=Tenacibaculum pelagium TaxID=2759527 RepID=A0A839AML5_9FLAO|nr:nucleotidyltransferase family protein [Tenacibaculum pelagium]MBA6155610.1 nucleotidyltransferase family protein [Tenacibaculum pelagium]